MAYLGGKGVCMQHKCKVQLENICWIISYDQVLIFNSNVGNNYCLGQLGNISCRHLKMLITFSPLVQTVSEC